MTAKNFDVDGIFATVDQKDADRYVTYFADGASFKMGNYPAAIGKEAIKNLAQGVFDSLAGLSHVITDVVEQQNPHVVVANGEVTYTRKDGIQKSYPFSGTYKLKDGLIENYQAYVDNHDLQWDPLESTCRHASLSIL